MICGLTPRAESGQPPADDVDRMRPAIEKHSLGLGGVSEIEIGHAAPLEWTSVADLDVQDRSVLLCARAIRATRR